MYSLVVMNIKSNIQVSGQHCQQYLQIFLTNLSINRNFHNLYFSFFQSKFKVNICLVCPHDRRRYIWSTKINRTSAEFQLETLIVNKKLLWLSCWHRQTSFLYKNRRKKYNKTGDSSSPPPPPWVRGDRANSLIFSRPPPFSSLLSSGRLKKPTQITLKYKVPASSLQSFKSFDV